MGFISDFLGIAAPIVLAGVTGGATLAPALAQAAPALAAILPKTPGATLISQVGGVANLPLQQQQAAAAAAAAAGGAGAGILTAVSEIGLTLPQILMINPGRQKNKVVTVVFHVNGTTGVIAKMEALQGKPSMMQSDQRRARAFIKKTSKAHASLPRKTVKESEMKQITGQILRNAVQRAITGPTCA